MFSCGILTPLKSRESNLNSLPIVEAFTLERSNMFANTLLLKAVFIYLI